jgi:hypothetical protein
VVPTTRALGLIARATEAQKHRGLLLLFRASMPIKTASQVKPHQSATGYRCKPTGVAAHMQGSGYLGAARTQVRLSGNPPETTPD